MALKAQEIGVLRFTSDALVSAPKKWNVTLAKVRERYKLSTELNDAFTAMDAELTAVEGAEGLDRRKIADAAKVLIGTTTPTLSGELAPRAAAGFALKWSLGEPRETIVATKRT